MTRIRERVGATFFATILRSALAFGTGIVVARALGPGGYGDLGFLLASFGAVNAFLDMGSASAFYTFLAQQPRSPRFLKIYFAWIVFQLLVPALVILGIPAALLHWLWVGHSRGLVLLAFISTFVMNQVWSMLSQMAEARRLTVRIQVATVALAFAHFALVGGVLAAGWLSVPAVLSLSLVEYLVGSGLLLPVLLRVNIDRRNEETTADVLRAFARYCQPLVLFGWAGVMQAFAERWLLQRYGGAVQQGFFTVASQLSIVGGILTMSVMRVLWKEVAEAVELKDAGRTQRLYEGAASALFLSIAWLCCLMLPYAPEILRWTVGAAFGQAELAFSLMLLYPIHQALGQTQATLLYASGGTRLYSRVGLASTALSLIATYWLIVPPTARVGGLGLGALGLALKTVLVNFLMVNVQAVLVARRYHMKVRVLQEGVLLAALVLLGLACRSGGGFVAARFGLPVQEVSTLAVGVLLYTLISGTLIVRFRARLGVERVLATIWPLRRIA